MFGAIEGVLGFLQFFFQAFFGVSFGWFKVGLEFVQGLFKVGLFSGSFKFLRFVKVYVHGSKHLILRRICLKHGSKADVGIILGKRKNAKLDAGYINVLYDRSLRKNTSWNNTAEGSPAWDSVDFGQVSAP